MDRFRQTVLITAVAVVGILVAGRFLLVSPKADEAAAIRVTVASQQGTNATLRTQLKVLQDKARRLTQTQARLAEIQRQLPDNPAYPTLIRQLSDAADAAGVSLLNLAPAKVLAAAPVAAAGAAGTAAAPAAGLTSLTPIGVTMSVTGNYAQVESFFSELEDLPRAMILKTFSMSPGGTGGMSVALAGSVFMVGPS